MAWDWDKLQQQQKKGGREGGSGGHSEGPPGFDEIINKIRGAKGKIHGGPILVILIFIVLYLGYSCVYKVELNQVGVVQRFGEYVRTESPGLNFKLPNGIEKVTKVNVKLTFKEEFGSSVVRQVDRRSRYSSTSTYLNESLMLTGDLNVAVVPWVVQYRINDPYKYLFKVRDVISTLRDLSESTMRAIVGDSSVDEVIKERQLIAGQAKDLLQKELNDAETGITVDKILMQKTNVPEPVQPSFNQVNQAMQEKETMIFKANEAYFKIIPAAKGNAEKTIKSAEGYALDRVNRAKGDAARFLSVYAEYSKAPDITRRRLYLESIQEILPKLGEKYIVDSDQKNLLPLLNLRKSQGEK
ncbi:MAG: FtsH protease activity modulator HflK [Deltaproteobacteria bacterium]|nr:FtsH protease activity modulator HflK [Deltaproteobacteria bacterium]